MDKYWIVAIVFMLCVGMVIYTQLKSDEKTNTQSLKQALQQTFPQFTVIEKFETLMICTMGSCNELEELVCIRIDPQQKKNIRQFGRRMTITYPRTPSMREIKKDVNPYLNQHL